MKPTSNPQVTNAPDEAICAWCHPGQRGNHTICPRHREELLASYHGDMRAPVEVAGTFRELERAAGRHDKITEMIHEDYHAGTGWGTAREILIGFFAGVLILGTAVLAMLAL